MNDERDYKQELIARESRKGGFRGKVNAKCIECIYDDRTEGNWRQQVQGCTSPACPLYAVRPVSSKTGLNGSIRTDATQA